MAKANYPSTEFVRQCFEYHDGKLFWKVRPPNTFNNPSHTKTFNKQFAGREAGSPRDHKQHNRTTTRHVIIINSIKFYRYKLVWILHGNEMISGKTLDHINRDSLNDKIENLRFASKEQQAGNCGKRSHNTTGYKWVSYDKRRKKYYAQMNKNKHHIFLGYFDDPEEAHKAAKKAAAERYGEFFHDGQDDI